MCQEYTNDSGRGIWRKRHRGLCARQRRARHSREQNRQVWQASHIEKWPSFPHPEHVERRLYAEFGRVLVFRLLPCGVICRFNRHEYPGSPWHKRPARRHGAIARTTGCEKSHHREQEVQRTVVPAERRDSASPPIRRRRPLATSFS